jgi:twitching motility protein PilT
VRAQLSFTIEAIACQQLVPKIGGGRCLAIEVLIPNPAVRNLIREDKVHQLYSSMQVGQSKFGMQTMNQSLAELVQKRLVNIEDALAKSPDQEEMRALIAQGPARKAAPPVK